MQIIDTYCEKKIIEITRIIENETVQWRCIYLPKVEELPKIIDRMSLEINILLKDVYKAYFFAMPNHEVFFFCKGGNEKLMQAVSHIMQDVAKDEEVALNLKLFDLSCDFEKLKEIVTPYVKETKSLETKTDVQKSTSSAIAPLEVEVDPQIIAQMKNTRNNRDKLKIMLVDDDIMTLKMVELILKDYDVVKSSGAQKALEDYFVEAPDIVFLDINMPPYSGHDILEKLVAYDDNAFVVMLSAHSYPSDIKKVMSVGAKGFVGKPFSKAKIFNYINLFMKLKTAS